MKIRTSTIGAAAIVGLGLGLSGCGGVNSGGSGGLGSGGIGSGGIGSGGGNGGRATTPRSQQLATSENSGNDSYAVQTNQKSGTLADLFTNRADPNTTVEVNKYIWNASLDVLNFLPLQAVDPFSGVIVTGYGTPPGGGRAYRATIYITDPALDARALKVSLQTRGGPANKATVRAVEDAILTRARQLRIRDKKL